MIRIEQKVWQRRKMVAMEVGYHVACVWAGIIAVIITLWLIVWAGRTVLGLALR